MEKEKNLLSELTGKKWGERELNEEQERDHTSEKLRNSTAELEEMISGKPLGRKRDKKNFSKKEWKESLVVNGKLRPH